MERHYTKEQILEAYLNQINLGRGWYGVEPAARHYFGKPAARLTLAEAATLAALPKSQPYYDPIALSRRARRAPQPDPPADGGAGVHHAGSSPSKTKREPVVTAPNARHVGRRRGYFVDAVRQQAERAGIPVMNGGYRIYTTLDPALQRSAVERDRRRHEQDRGAEGLQASHAGRREGQRRRDYLQAMAVAIDPHTGDVRALVGGRNYAARAVQPRDHARCASPVRRSSRSSTRRRSRTASRRTRSFPTRRSTIPLINGDDYKPEEIDGKFWGFDRLEGKDVGAMTMREGLIHSRNMVAIQLGMRVGMDSVAALAQRLGITTPMDPVPASAIGASVVHPIDSSPRTRRSRTTAQVVQPRFITRIDDLDGPHGVSSVRRRRRSRCSTRASRSSCAT